MDSEGKGLEVYWPFNLCIRNFVKSCLREFLVPCLIRSTYRFSQTAHPFLSAPDETSVHSGFSMSDARTDLFFRTNVSSKINQRESLE